MPTERQSESARINGAKSRGPKSAEGKKKSSRNSPRHARRPRTHQQNYDTLPRVSQQRQSGRAPPEPPPAPAPTPDLDQAPDAPEVLRAPRSRRASPCYPVNPKCRKLAALMKIRS